MSGKVHRIPFKWGKRADGRQMQYLSALQCQQLAYVVRFIRRFPKCFERDPVLNCYWFYPLADSPEPVTEEKLHAPAHH